MIAGETSLLFFSASLLLALAPGPDNLFVLMHSARHGRGAGMLVVLGLCTGLLFHTAAVALGAAALFAASAAAFTALKMIGAAYLAWLAWQAFRAPGSAEEGGPREAGSGWRLYRRGIVMNVTNPKVSIFFLAFLPQFTEPERGAVGWQVVWLGLVFMAATLLVFGAVAFFAGAVGGWLQRSAQARRWLDRLAGVVFLALAVRLAVAER